MICINGGGECTGCMDCYNDNEKIYCCECGRELDPELPIYEDRYNDTLCEECLLMLHEKI